MENASKALLIAGAILIVIVLISIGMMIVSSSQDTIGQVGDLTTGQAVRTFNEQYQNYQGDQRGASVKTLLNLVSVNNSSNSSGRTISITITDSKKAEANLSKTTDSTKITQAGANIVSSATYTVQIESQDKDGYYTGLTITRK